MSNKNNQEVLEDIKNYIENTNNILEDLIEDIRENNNIENLPNLMEGLLYCSRGLELTKELHTVEVDEQFLKEKFEEILEAIENQDFNLIADIIDYEILELVENINENLQNI